MARIHICGAVLLTLVALLRIVIGPFHPGQATPAVSTAQADNTRSAGQVQISGRIIDAAERPIEGAAVEIVCTAASKPGITLLTCTTDARGAWKAAVETGLYVSQIAVYHPDYVDSRFNRLPRPQMERMRDGTGITKLEPGVPIFGNVTNSSGDPVAGARLLIGWLSSDDRATIADAKGKFKLGGVPRGRHDLAVFADGHAPQVLSVDAGAEGSKLAIQLDQGKAIHGRIVDEDGRPIEGAHVRVSGWSVANEYHLSREAVTDFGGRFDLTRIPSQGILSIEYSKTEYLRSERKGLVARDEPYTITLYRPTVIEGRVVDDETGLPIPVFEAVSGRRWLAGIVPFKRSGRLTESENGEFRCQLSFAIPPNPGFAVRVFAPGYLPADTPVLKVGERIEPLTLRLRRAHPMSGIVIDADDRPVAGAQVAWVGPGRSAWIRDCRISQDGTYAPESIVSTDAEGHFELPPTEEPGRIVVVHSDGYALRKSDEHAVGLVVRLTRWAHVEATVECAKAGAAAQFALSPADSEFAGPRSPIVFQLSGHTGSDGTIALDHVPAIPLEAGWYASTIFSHVVPVAPRAGETLHVRIGNHEGAVQGEVEKPRELDMPEFFGHFEANRFMTEVVAFPVNDREKARDARANFAGIIDPDGTFRVRGLPPNKYELNVNVHAPVPPGSCGVPGDVGRASSIFEVRESSADPIRLGRLSLTIRRGPYAGQMVPRLTGQTLAAAPFELSRLKGKIVLLDFWATWCAPCLAATGQVAEIYERLGADDRLAIVGVNIDSDTAAARDYVEQERLPWPHVSIGNWGEDNPVLERFGISSVPSFWIIGPDGIILARDVPLASLSQALEEALQD